MLYWGCQTRLYSCMVTAQDNMQRHATVMGSTWGLLIPAAILMARLRNKKGWWFHLHRALAIASLFLVVVGAILGHRLRLTHPPVSTAGKLHKLFGYTALIFICLQVGRIHSSGYCSSMCAACICITSVSWLGHDSVHNTISHPSPLPHTPSGSATRVQTVQA